MASHTTSSYSQWISIADYRLHMAVQYYLSAFMYTLHEKLVQCHLLA